MDATTVPAAAPMSEKRCRFFELPPEIRDVIYQAIGGTVVTHLWRGCPMVNILDYPIGGLLRVSKLFGDEYEKQLGQSRMIIFDQYEYAYPFFGRIRQYIEGIASEDPRFAAIGEHAKRFEFRLYMDMWDDYFGGLQASRVWNRSTDLTFRQEQELQTTLDLIEQRMPQVINIDVRVDADPISIDNRVRSGWFDLELFTNGQHRTHAGDVQRRATLNRALHLDDSPL